MELLVQGVQGPIRLMPMAPTLRNDSTLPDSAPFDPKIWQHVAATVDVREWLLPDSCSRDWLLGKRSHGLGSCLQDNPL